MPPCYLRPLARFLIAAFVAGAAFAATPLPAAKKEPYSAKTFFSGSLMPNAERRRLASRLLGNLWARDGEVDYYLWQISRALAPEDDFLIVVADDPMVNAFAFHAGIIAMFRGIMNFADNEDEFLSVVAHEMGHIKLGHFKRSQENAEKAALLSLPLLVAGLLVKEADATEALILGGTGVLSSNLYSYSRELEHEADIFGLDTMLAASKSGGAMAEVFSRMASSGTYEYLSTHPAPLRRQAYLRARLPAAEPPPTEGLSFYLLREKLAAGETNAAQTRRDKRRAIRDAATPTQKTAAQYALLLLATQTHDKKLGAEMRAALAAEQHPFARRAVAANLLAFNMRAEAEEILRQTLAEHPRNSAPALDLLRLRERNGEHEQALRFYDGLSEEMRERPDILEQAGRAAALAGKRALSNYYLALGQANDGRFEQALRQIAVARRHKDGDTNTIIALEELKDKLSKELLLLRTGKIQPQAATPRGGQPHTH